MPDLIKYSIDVIRRFQEPSGAYPACPTMPDYQFCWFRDGSFIAHAMLLHNVVSSATSFHQWAARTILAHQEGAHRAMIDFQSGKTPNPQDVLRARYTYDGDKGPDEWPEYQLDGLGTWLWALKVYEDRGNVLDNNLCEAAELVADYLSVLWPSPCHDLWEEHGDQVHTYTLAAIYAGLQAASEILQHSQYAQRADLAREFLMKHCVHPELGFIKSAGNDLVDGSLTALGIPYGVTSLEAPAFLATVRRIEAQLYTKGVGIHRYVGDSYYGGGAWPLLLAWLGWYCAERGDIERAKTILHEIDLQATGNGDLPEQIAAPTLREMSHYDFWVKTRGEIATPLLWSHAMYLILVENILKSKNFTPKGD
jgi:GH15 family glucan-1,4-alpha-glucosidase